MLLSVYNIEELYEAPVLPVQLPEDNTFMGWLSICKDDSLARFTKIRKQQSIIDHFIETDPKIQPVKGVLNDMRDFDNDEKPARAPKMQYIVSETLAKIYHQQKKYSLAIQTYKRLRLVYPEKSAYFARLIGNIEKETEK